MTPTSLFEVLRYKKSRGQSGQFTSAALVSDPTLAAGTETIARGVALGAHATDGEALNLAAGSNFIGFLTRRVVVGGLSPLERAMIAATGIPGPISATPVGIESPFVDGQEVTVRLAEEIEAEGVGYLASGVTGALTSETAVGEKLSFYEGKLRSAQSGDVTYFTLTANNLTPNTSSNLRIRAVAA